jgi:hypothetical protein
MITSVIIHKIEGRGPPVALKALPLDQLKLRLISTTSMFLSVFALQPNTFPPEAGIDRLR